MALEYSRQQWCQWSKLAAHHSREAGFLLAPVIPVDGSELGFGLLLAQRRSRLVDAGLRTSIELRFIFSRSDPKLGKPLVFSNHQTFS